MSKIDKDVRNFFKVGREPYKKQLSVIRAGIRPSLFTKTAKYFGMSQRDFANTLNLEARTLRNRTLAKRFNEIESEKSLRVARVHAKARDALGSDERARTWIVSPIKSLGNRRPIEFLATDVGTQEVLNVLNAIEWGVYL